MDALVLLGQNDMLIRVTLKLKKDGSAITQASPARVTLYDVDGHEVVGQTWPTNLTHQADGVWEATCSRDVQVSIGDQLILEVDVVDTVTALRFYSRPRVIVQERTD